MVPLQFFLCYFLHDCTTGQCFISALVVHCFKSRKMQPSSVKSMVASIQFHLHCLALSTISLLENSSICLLLNGFKKEKPQGNDQHLTFTLPLLLQLILHLREGCFGSYTVCFAHSFLWFSQRCGEFTTRTDSFNPSQDLTVSDVAIYSHYPRPKKQS